MASVRYTPWPFYYDWLELFSNMGATGNSRQTVIDVVNDLVSEDAGENATMAKDTSSHQGVGKKYFG